MQRATDRLTHCRAVHRSPRRASDYQRKADCHHGLTLSTTAADDTNQRSNPSGRSAPDANAVLLSISLILETKRNRMHCNRTVIALLLLTSSLGYAQDTTPSERETIQKLVQQVKELQDEVKLLESQRASDANQSAAPQPVAGPAPAEEKAGSTQRQSLAQELHELHGIQWRGFGE